MCTFPHQKPDLITDVLISEWKIKILHWLETKKKWMCLQEN